jgi:hypothetical protein
VGYLTWILGFLGAIMLGLVKDEISAWLPRLARWCVCRAADRMPDRERSREEWLAHLEECPGKLGQLIHAFGVLGMGEARRWRFWFEVLRHLPGIRWSIIDSCVSLVGISTAVAFLYNWYVSSDLATVFAAVSFILTIVSLFTERRATKLLLRDQEMIECAIAYRKSIGTW